MAAVPGEATTLLMPAGTSAHQGGSPFALEENS